MMYLNAYNIENINIHDVNSYDRLVITVDNSISYNEETGDKSLKKVVDLLRNKTNKWINLLFELNDGKTEEIVCTEGHPFYVNNIGWVKSIDLLENDSILMYNNCSATLKQKDNEELEVEKLTYNIEVEDFHTYYVGENSFLVHNICTKANTKKYSPDILSTKTGEIAYQGRISKKFLDTGLNIKEIIKNLGL